MFLFFKTIPISRNLLCINLLACGERGINRAIDASGVCMKEIKARDVCLCVKELEDKIWLLTEFFTSLFLFFFRTWAMDLGWECVGRDCA